MVSMNTPDQEFEDYCKPVETKEARRVELLNALLPPFLRINPRRNRRDPVLVIERGDHPVFPSRTFEWSPNSHGATIKGAFTAAELRAIADAMDGMEAYSRGWGKP
jgi:hypothetical protein